MAGVVFAFAVIVCASFGSAASAQQTTLAVDAQGDVAAFSQLVRGGEDDDKVSSLTALLGAKLDDEPLDKDKAAFRVALRKLLDTDKSEDVMSRILAVVFSEATDAGIDAELVNEEPVNVEPVDQESVKVLLKIPDGKAKDMGITAKVDLMKGGGAADLEAKRAAEKAQKIVKIVKLKCKYVKATKVVVKVVKN